MPPQKTRSPGDKRHEGEIQLGDSTGGVAKGFGGVHKGGEIRREVRKVEDIPGGSGEEN